MLSDTVRFVDLSIWPQLSLVLFMGVFLLVSYRAIRASRNASREMASVPLDFDDEVLPSSETQTEAAARREETALGQ